MLDVKVSGVKTEQELRNTKDIEERDKNANKDSYMQSSSVGLLSGVMRMEPRTVQDDKKWV